VIATSGPSDRHGPPAGAVHDAELDAWEVSTRNAQGEREGESTLYRDDGSVLVRCRYAAGKRNGVFTSYHPSGEVASEGSYANGLLDGTFVRQASSAPGSEPLRNCCVPRGARTLRASYRAGSLVHEVFYDAEGRALRSDGELVPERAPGVPLDALFDERDERWVLRLESGNDVELQRYFDLGGRLVEEADVVLHRVVALRSFGADEKLACARGFDRAGRLHGACQLVHGDDAPYSDASVCEERGSFTHGQSTGLFRYFDAAGRELVSKDRGEPLSDELLRDLSTEERLGEPAEALFRRADELFHAHHVREALFVAACAGAKLGSVEKLNQLLERSTVPLKPEIARARLAPLDGNAELTAQGAFDALLAGADPAGVLRLLSVLVPSASPAPRLLVDAAVLLAPERERLRVTRALIRLEQGDVEGALADVSTLGSEYTEAVEHVRELVRILFAKPEFTPPREPPPAPPAELAEVGVEQSIEALRRGVALYATRLGVIRREIRRRLGDATPEWLPPDLSHLLDNEPLELRRHAATITDDDEDGTEKSEVEIDETLAVSTLSVKTLMIVARAEFDALCWLCWSAGLDRIALPTTLTPRADFAAAVNDSMHRCFRAHDQLNTAGLLSKSRSIPGFVWDELAVERLSHPLAEIAVHQYRERRAMFFWLMFSQNLSPFQSDLRKL